MKRTNDILKRREEQELEAGGYKKDYIGLQKDLKNT